MSTFQERLDNAAGEAACQILSAAGEGLITAAAYSMVIGPVAKVPLTLGAVALFASKIACPWDTEQPSTLPTGDTNIVPGSCMETDGCGLLLRDVDDLQFGPSRVQKLISCVDTTPYPNGTPRVITTIINCDGIEESFDASKSRFPIRTLVAEFFNCVGDPAPDADPVYPPYEYTEPGPDGCSLTVNVLGWGAEGDGTVAPIYKIEPSAALRSGGGVIGGCNFEPVVYYQPQPPGGGGGGGEGGGGDGKPPYTIPFVDGDGEDGDPEWLKLLKRALAGAAGELIVSTIQEILEAPMLPVVYEMTAPCDVDEEGNPLVWTGDIPAQKFEPAVLDRLDAISNQVSQHLAWKTPICVPETPELEGDFRTISFRSDEASPFSQSRLRKRLRYRSRNGSDLSALVDYWKDFTWTGGATRVRWSGGAWGTVEVWAASESEGKRVIQHAAGEAGFDAFETGGWSVRVTSSPRLGVSLLMRVDTTKGFYWITARDGSDGKPIVALTHD